MAVKTVELIRAIRDKHYEDTKSLSVEEQIRYFEQKAKLLSDQMETKSDESSDSSHPLYKGH
ncbi:hypothetical protein [Candidatus Magnetobacterium casense]|uniref:hypothetical protein n=1 Tax=Candidatus Magnetobacterium casense TaxID=1455061 RepID=UPI0005902722|nr:hypothetical protein [Candidatus Magnetobacterium casensis]